MPEREPEYEEIVDALEDEGVDPDELYPRDTQDQVDPTWDSFRYYTYE